MKERLMTFLKSQGLTSSKLAELIGVQPSGISHIISGRNKPGFDFLVKMIQVFPDLNPDWLLLGTGNMYRDDKQALQKDGSIALESSQEATSHRETTAEPSLFESTVISRQLSNDSIGNKQLTNHASDKLEHENRQSEPMAPIVNLESDHIMQIIVCYDDKTFSIYRHRDQ